MLIKKILKNWKKFAILSKPQNWEKMTCTMVPIKECGTFNGLHFPKNLKAQEEMHQINSYQQDYLKFDFDMVSPTDEFGKECFGLLSAFECNFCVVW
jgi:hypothetical protein